MKYDKVDTKVVCEGNRFSIRIAFLDQDGDLDKLGDVLLEARTYTELVRLRELVEGSKDSGGILHLTRENRGDYL